MTSMTMKVGLTVGAILFGSTLVAQQPRPLQPDEYGRWEQLAAQRTPLSPDGRWLVYGITRVEPSERTARAAERRRHADHDRVRRAAGVLGRLAVAGLPDWLLRRTGSQAAQGQEAAPQAARHSSSSRPGKTDHGRRRSSRSRSARPARTWRCGATRRNRATEETAATNTANAETVQPGHHADRARARDRTRHDLRIRLRDRLAGQGHAARACGHGRGRRRQRRSAVRHGDRRAARARLVGVHLQRPGWRKELVGACGAAIADRRRARRVRRTRCWRGPTSARARRRRASSTPAKSGLAGRPPRRPLPRAAVVRGRRASCSSASRPWHAKPARPMRARQSRRIAATSDESRRAAGRAGLASEGPDRDAEAEARRAARSRAIDAGRVVDRRRPLRSHRADDRRRSDADPTVGPRARRRHQRLRAWSAASAASYANAWTVDLAVRRENRGRISASKIATLQASPGGRYLLYLKDDHYWTVDLASGKQTNITASASRRRSSTRSPTTPSRRSRRSASPAGRRATQSVLLYDKLDIWEVKPDGSGATRLTNGAGRRDPPPLRATRSRRGVDRSHAADRRVAVRPAIEEVRLCAHRCRSPRPSVTSLVLLDKRVDRLAKAKRADRFVYAVQDFDDSPDYFVGGATLADAKQVTDDQPVHARLRVGPLGAHRLQEQAGPAAAGRAVLSRRLRRRGRKYPMVVYMYEKLSDGVHQFSMPSERDYYNAAAFTTRGYVYLQPDIVFRPRDPGLSVVESVVPAVQRVIADGHRRSGQGRHRRPLVGRVRQRVPGDAHQDRSRRRSPARRSPIWSATTATITGRAASPRPITSRPASSACRCRSTRTCRPTSATRRSTRAHTMTDAAADRCSATTTARCTGTRASSCTTSRGGPERTWCCCSTAARIMACASAQTRSTITTGSSSGSITT